MPWCEPCGRFYTPSTLTPDGDCPGGHHVADASSQPSVPAGGAGPGHPSEAERVRAPWHFWVLVAALAAYLLWRLVQGIGWLFG